ncbi:hypothetical protein CROQUDRAFT_36628 [Cronartium quercuum f. sp. fusiforme G11]|uniref:Uncharacterized protein n=1 Tax=Cronartium quercuum f. sp. fusiforme G11 TaxID=708437 RepID=A0A9P6NWN4_9BASI|nr:hypothetical protein CROQUDRAFT_36628 [Cronartium quercuum f. sp. fusiforme G11]
MTSNQPQLQAQVHSFDSPFQHENGLSPLPPLGPGPSLDHARSNSENRREPRSRTQSYMDAVRTGRGLLDDHVPPRSNTTVACSSQHILATALRRDLETSETMSLNAITIAFSLFPVGSRPTPSWLFTLPSPSIPPLKHRPAHRKSHQPMCPAEVDHLLFSPDGTHLLVCSHTSSTHPGLGHLRLSILVQSSSKADQWSLAWDEVVCDWSVRGVHERAPLEPHVKRVIKARFLGEPRRWFIDPAGPAVPEEESLSIGSTKYRKPQKTCGAPINGLTDGKGPTAILVLNTNELFVIHIPFRQSNLPPHVLLTTMSNSTIASGPLHLIPTPGSNRLDKKRTITQDTEQPLPGPPETVIAQLTRKAHEVVAQHVGLGLSVDSVPYPETIESSSSFPSLGASHNGLAEFSILPLLAAIPHDTPGLETANPHGETSIQFNPNGYNQFEVSMNYFRSTRKEIVIAAIGFPAHLEHPDPNTEEPVLLIAFQTRTKPIIPTPVKQVVLPPSTQAPEGTADEGMQQDLQFSMAEDDYITGLGDLDDAFDMPTANKPSAPSLVTEEVGGEEKDEEANEASKRKAKSELRKEQHKRRRFEPISGIDESGDQAGAGGQTAYGFIDLVEIFVDFEDGVIPTISIQPLPSVPILDPADSTAESRVTIRSLDFIEPDIERGSEIQLLAGYSHELEESNGGTEDEKKSVDELQLWDVSHTRPELSSGFLGLECVGAHRKAQAVRGPPEWVRLPM